MNRPTHPIIFFDGVCSVCNHFVDFVLKRDPELFLFASLQGETAHQKLDRSLLGDEPNSMVLCDQDGVYVKSRAVLRVLSQLGWAWKWVNVFTIFPTTILDWGYDFFASHRYQWFGKKDTCRIPTPAERARFLA